MNPFVYQASAQRYSAYRPYFHPIAMSHIKDMIGLSSPLPYALDVACGTGHSALALKALAHKVIGVDLSPEMLSQVPSDPAIHYAQSAAETLPFPDNTFELITVGLAFHWFNREAFLSEACRLLKPGGWLAIYNNGFANEMEGNPAYGQWMKENYHARYPRRPRRGEPLSQADAQNAGLQLVKHETYTNEQAFAVDELALYLMTHSNIVVAIETGQAREEDVFAELVEGMTPFFAETKAMFKFGGFIDYLQKPLH